MNINYDECVSQANKLQSIAYDYQRLYNTVMNLANESSEYWQGEANQAFKEKIEAWKLEAISIKNEMEELSYLIREVSRQVRDEEMEG